MSRRRIKQNRIRRQEERGIFSDVVKPTRFDNSHKPRDIDFLDADDGREEYEEAAHMRRSRDRDLDGFDESLFRHDLISLVVHIIFAIVLVIVGIVKLHIFPVVVLAVLVIMMLMGFLLRTAPFFVPFGIATIVLIVGALTNNTESVLFGLPAMYGIIILTRDL